MSSNTPLDDKHVHAARGVLFEGQQVYGPGRQQQSVHLMPVENLDCTRSMVWVEGV